VKLAFIFAHPDDESFSTGGTIARYSSTGNDVSCLCLTTTDLRKNEFINATKILGVQNRAIFDFSDVVNHIKEIQEKVILFLLKNKPDIVVTHLRIDNHIDHRTTFKIVKESIEWAARETQHNDPHLISKLYSTETTILIPDPHILVDISDYYSIKEEAIKCYKSQLAKGGEDFYIRFHKNRTLMRGTQASVKHAEAFIQIPLKQNSPFYKLKHSEL